MNDRPKWQSITREPVDPRGIDAPADIEKVPELSADPFFDPDDDDAAIARERDEWEQAAKQAEAAKRRLSEMLERYEQRNEILRSALMQWPCDRCNGSGNENDYGGEVPWRLCDACGGGKVHPIARDAITEAALQLVPGLVGPDDEGVPE